MLEATILTEQEREDKIRWYQKQKSKLNGKHGIFGGGQSVNDEHRTINKKLEELGQMENELIPYDKWLASFKTDTPKEEEKDPTLRSFFRDEEWTQLQYQEKLRIIINQQLNLKDRKIFFQEYSSGEFAEIDNYRAYLLGLMHSFRPHFARILHSPTSVDINRIYDNPQHNPRIELPNARLNYEGYLIANFAGYTGEFWDMGEGYVVYRSWEDSKDVFYIFCH